MNIWEPCRPWNGLIKLLPIIFFKNLLVHFNGSLPRLKKKLNICRLTACLFSLLGRRKGKARKNQLYHTGALLEEERQRKVRTTFSESQIFDLESTFKSKKYLFASERRKLAEVLCVTEQQVWTPMCTVHSQTQAFFSTLSILVAPSSAFFALQLFLVQ